MAVDLELALNHQFQIDFFESVEEDFEIMSADILTSR